MLSKISEDGNTTVNVTQFKSSNNKIAFSVSVKKPDDQYTRTFEIDKSKLTTKAIDDIANYALNMAENKSITSEQFQEAANTIKQNNININNTAYAGSTFITPTGVYAYDYTDAYKKQLDINNTAAHYLDIDPSNGDPNKFSKSAIEIKQLAGPSNYTGISEQSIKSTVTGDLVDPFGYKIPSDPGVSLKETISGSDMAIFILYEVPYVEDIIDGVPEEARKKELMLFELDNTLSISYSITREKFPVRAIGHISPKGFTRSIRTISGHITFTIFTKDIVSELRSQMTKQIEKMNAAFDNYTPQSEKASNDMIDKYTKVQKTKKYYNQFVEPKVQLLDSLPSFHIMALGLNETGVMSKFIIKNVEILDENQYQGIQQPNIINKITFTAKDIVPMNTTNYGTTTIINSVNSIEEKYFNGKYNANIKINKEITGSSVLTSIYNDLTEDDDVISG